MNSIPRVVFPVPAPPSTRMTLPRRRPPDRMSSSPAMPVATRSRSGMVDVPDRHDGRTRNRRSHAEQATLASLAVLRLSLLQQSLQHVPPIRDRAHASQGLQPVLDVIDFEDVHPAGGAVLERPFKEAAAKQSVER